MAMALMCLVALTLGPIGTASAFALPPAHPPRSRVADLHSTGGQPMRRAAMTTGASAAARVPPTPPPLGSSGRSMATTLRTRTSLLAVALTEGNGLGDDTPSLLLPSLPPWAPPAGRTSLVSLYTTKGEVMLVVYEGWAPYGAARFLDMVPKKRGY